MSPMTRFRVDEKGVPTPLNASYYSQRASAGLIISEYCYVHPEGRSAARAAGLYSESQVKAWSRITGRVRDKGGRMFAQLGHGGRVSHSGLQPGGVLPIAPSAIAPDKRLRLKESESGILYGDPEVPRPMTKADIDKAISQFAEASARAIDAGFSGVELHGGSGFLHHQFLSNSSNKRSDQYGGSIANRCRFILETLEAMAGAIGSDRVGVKISPNFGHNAISDTQPDIEEMTDHLACSLNGFDLAYVHVQFPPWGLFSGEQGWSPIPRVRKIYKGTLIAAGEFDRHSGEQLLAEGGADLIAYGRRFIANPDLPKRFKLSALENAWDEATLYAPSAEGLTDYPTLDQL